MVFYRNKLLVLSILSVVLVTHCRGIVPFPY